MFEFISSGSSLGRAARQRCLQPCDDLILLLVTQTNEHRQ
jgi:hypothetical protein